MDSRFMRDYFRNFSLDNGPLGNQGYSRVLLQLFGFTGHGKSSFINSCKYVLDDGPYTAHAKVAGSAEKPETMIRKAYELTENITLVDNRGCAKLSKDETGEIYAQLGNFLPLGCEVKWRSEYEDMVNIVLSADFVDRSADFIVAVFIYSASTQITSAEESELKDILTKARNITGLFPTVVITRKLSEHLQEVQEKFRMMGVENIFPVENYTAEDHRKTRGKHEGILKCLYEIVRDVEFKMEETRIPGKEKLERKRILLEFAHNRDLEKVQEKLDRQVARWEDLEKWIREGSETFTKEALLRRMRRDRLRCTTM
ncbi:uncharacterized protein ACNLHF_026509 isoform 2-T2 [Anomaloglossus baeobatrachus]|uniref:uncharacterized protein LOC142245713 isoform X2 n=1 Tax=Anomaloglossus baeobatrachus TaxID=238106 RepID=UPI003F500F8A